MSIIDNPQAIPFLTLPFIRKTSFRLLKSKVTATVNYHYPVKPDNFYHSMTRNVASQIALFFCIFSKSWVGISREQLLHTLKHFTATMPLALSVLQCHQYLVSKMSLCHHFPVLTMSQYHYCSVPNVTVSLLLSAKCHIIITAQCHMSQYHYFSVSVLCHSIIAAQSWACHIIVATQCYVSHVSLLASTKLFKCRSCLALRSSQYKYLSMRACHNIVTAKSTVKSK